MTERQYTILGLFTALYKDLEMCSVREWNHTQAVFY